MSAAAFFDAARALKRELTGNAAIGLTQGEVDAFEALIATWGPPETAVDPTGLADEGKLFAAVRAEFGALSQPQVDGMQTLLQAFAVAAWPVAFAAYGLATAWHETNKALQPVAEAYYLGSKAEAYRKTLRYYPWVGRGFVQLTWQRNYQRADEELGLAGALLADPDMALQPAVAAKIMVEGMAAGWFSGKKLADYLPTRGPADGRQFTLARYIINGADKASTIAGYALQFQDALEAGGWA